MGVNLDDDVGEFANEVGRVDPVTVVGTSTRGGPVPGVRAVSAPSGIDWIEPAEMTIRCGAGTDVAELDAALAQHRQCLAVPGFGTIGGALAVGHSDIRRLGWGPARDTLLQARYVAASGEVVKAGGPTVKNVSGFDLCRLLVGSHGTLGFLADLILRTRPLPSGAQWYTSDRDPWDLLVELHRPTSVLWDGVTTSVLLEGNRVDIEQQAQRTGLRLADGPPPLPPNRRSMAPASLQELRAEADGPFVAEIGVGIVHSAVEEPTAPPSPEVTSLHRRIKHEFDPTERLNPGVDVLTAS